MKRQQAILNVRQVMTMRSSEIGFLSQRIQSGKAEPVSDFEKELAERIMRKYEDKYGQKKTAGLVDRERRQVLRRAS